MMEIKSVSLADAPMGVFRRVAGDHGAPATYFIIKTCTSFGNAENRDVSFQWDMRQKASVTVRVDGLIEPHAWKIRNDNANQFFFNEKLFKAGQTATIRSGDTFRFGEYKVNSLTYSFHLFTEDNPVPPEEAEPHYNMVMRAIDLDMECLSTRRARLAEKVGEIQRAKAAKRAAENAVAGDKKKVKVEPSADVPGERAKVNAEADQVKVKEEDDSA